MLKQRVQDLKEDEDGKGASVTARNTQQCGPLAVGPARPSTRGPLRHYTSLRDILTFVTIRFPDEEKEVMQIGEKDSAALALRGTGFPALRVRFRGRGLLTSDFYRNQRGAEGQAVTVKEPLGDEEDSEGVLVLL